MTKAETIWALKVVDSNFSFNSTHDLVDILAAMDPKSEVFKKMSMGETKTSYVISHGLYPYFLKKIVKAIQDSPAYSLGTDAGTFKLHGLSKLVDVVIRFAQLLTCSLLLASCSLLTLALAKFVSFPWLRYWDPKRGEVVDSFLDYHSVGHEPADTQVKQSTIIRVYFCLLDFR